MSNQNARQDDNQFPALIAHTGTAGTAETRRVVVDTLGNLGVTVTSQGLAVYLDGTTTASVTYVGQAAAGAAATATVWQLKKIDETGGTNGDLVITWADGNTNFDNAWSGRASGTYS